MLQVLLTAILFLFAQPAFAQDDTTSTKHKRERQVTIHGEVYDSFTKAKLKAHVTLMRQDSTVIDTMTCWTWGTNSYYYFSVPAKPQHIILKGTCAGYEDTYLNYELRYLARNIEIELPRMLMKKKMLQDDIWREDSLGDVMVRGTKVKIAYRGDTVVYNAAAFNLPEGSMLDGLIRQLPGAELKSNGDIYINGEKIDYLTLNGKDFFKGQNQVMLDNLPYYTVQNIKVFHQSTKQSRLAGREVEKKDYVMDVVLKREYNRGYIANAEAGMGTEHRWLARLFGLYYTDHSRYTLFGNVNNVNENRKPGSEGDWSPSEMPQGLHVTRQTGFDFSTEDADKHFEEEGSVSLEWTDATNEARTTTETFSAAGSIFSGAWNESRQKDFRLHARNGFMLKLPIQLNVDLNLNIASGRLTSSSIDSTYRQFIINQSQRGQFNKYRLYSGSVNLSHYKKLPWGDQLSVSAYAAFNCNKPSDNFSRQHTRYAQTDDPDDRIERYADTHSNSYEWQAVGNYTIALPANWFVSPGVAYKQEFHDNHNFNYLLSKLGNLAPHDLGWLPSTHDSLLLVRDLFNWDQSELLTRSYEASVDISHSSNDAFFSLRLPFRHIAERLHYDDGFLDTIARRHSNEFCPTLSFYRWKGGAKYVMYSMQVSRPELASLLPTDEMLDPLVWRINNPGLKARVAHHLGGRYSVNIDSLKREFAVWANGRYELNNVGTQRFYDVTTGASAYIDDNVDGNWGTELGVSYSCPLDRRRLLLLSLQATGSYGYSVDFDTRYRTFDELQDMAFDLDADIPGIYLQDPVLSTVHNWVMGSRLQLQYQKDQLSASFSGSLSWRRSTGDRQNFQAINAVDFDYGATCNYNIPFLHIDLSTDVRMFSRRGYYSSLMNDNHLVWNLQLSRSLFKQRLTAKLQAFDLLHQLSDTQYNINAQGRTETWRNCLPRYFMFTLQYKFSKSPKQK